MITFETVTQIESYRRQIEGLQEDLNEHVVRIYGSMPKGTNQWHPAPEEAQGILREAMCKWTVARIVVLLDASAKLGVDTTAPREALVKALEQVKS